MDPSSDFVLDATPMLEAVTSGDVERVLELLEAGANPNARGTDGVGVLHAALLAGCTKRRDEEDDPKAVSEAQAYTEIIGELLSRGATTGLNEALGTACWAGALKMVVPLLAHGANPNWNQGYPLGIAADGCFTGILTTLIATGADVNQRDEQGGTALYAAAAVGCAEVVSLLLAHGADPELRDEHWGMAPLHVAVWESYPDVVHALLAGGADPNARTRHGQTPLAVARSLPPVAQGRKEIIGLLSHRPRRE